MYFICHDEFGRLLNEIRLNLLCTNGISKFLDVDQFEEHLYSEIIASQSAFINAANDYFTNRHLPYEAIQGIERVLIRKKVVN